MRNKTSKMANLEIDDTMTSPSIELTSRKNKKLKRLNEIRQVLQNGENSWSEIKHALSIGDSTLHGLLSQLIEDGEIVKGRCNQSSQERRICYAIVGGGRPVMIHILSKIKDNQSLRAKLKYYGLLFGAGSYKFWGIMDYGVIKEVLSYLNMIDVTYNELHSKLSIYENLIKNIHKVKLSKKEKLELYDLMYDYLKKLLAKYGGKEDHIRIETAASVFALMLALRKEELFSLINEMFHYQSMKSTECEQYTMVYAPIMFILDTALGIIGPEYEKDVLRSLKSNEMKIIDMYANCREDEEFFYKHLLGLVGRIVQEPGE
ncbi:MAG: hypothetical protein QXU18_03265 [Thermoplasmatales archaeon]